MKRNSVVSILAPGLFGIVLVATLLFGAVACAGEGQPNPPPGEPESALQQQLKAEVGDRIFFDNGANKIRDDQKPVLDKLASWLSQTQPEARVVIEGHAADSEGTRINALALAELRAIEVEKYLIDHGVARDRIATVSRGKSNPGDPDNDDLNRRAQFVIAGS